MHSSENNRYQFMLQHSLVTQLLVLMYALISGILFFFIPGSVQFALLVSGLISLGYILPLVFKKRLRDLGNAKIILISIVWALLPILSNLKFSHLTGNSLLFIEHFLFIFALTIPFDVRDQDLDKKAKVSNLANKLGISKLEKLMLGCLLLASTIAFFLYLSEIYKQQVFIAMILFYLLLYLSIQNLTNRKPEWYYLFYLDGLIAVKGLLYFISL